MQSLLLAAALISAHPADFRVERQRVAMPAAVRTGNAEDCRAHIREVICLADEPDAACQPGGEAYARPFEDLYDRYPPTMQKMFCSLRRIWVLNKFFGTAFAGTILKDDGTIDGAQMGIRRSVLDEKVSLQTWATWKEELSFGGVTGSYEATPGLPKVETQSNGAADDFLYFVVTHEFGHIFDFANALNQVESDAPDAAATPGSWTALSWATSDAVLPANRFPFRRGLCFYACDGEFMTRVAAPEVYRGLARTNFLSTYAATNPWDDFADSLAYYLLDKNLGTSYELQSGQGESFDIMAKLHGDLFATKRQYISDFLSRPAVTYP